MTTVSQARTAVPHGAAVPALTRWGLSADADLVFRTLVTFGPQTRRMLASGLGVPVRRVEVALAELRAADAARTDPRSPSPRDPHWGGRPAAEVIERLRTARLRLVDGVAQARTQQRIVGMLTDRLGSLGIGSVPAVGGVVTDDVRFLATRALSRDRLTALRAAERHDRLVINPEQTFDAQAMRGASAGMRSLLDRKIRVRVLGVPPPDGDRDQFTDKPDDPALYQYRELPELPLKLFVLDHRIALFPADPVSPGRGYFEVHHHGIVDALVRIFEKRWATALDPALDGVPRILLSDREQALVDLLALGHTDVTAAAALRISARSVTYALRTLMDRVGVENRFQLGLALGTLRAAAPPTLAPELFAPAGGRASRDAQHGGLDDRPRGQRDAT